jgi:hypothetical protein
MAGKEAEKPKPKLQPGCNPVWREFQAILETLRKRNDEIDKKESEEHATTT